MSSDILAGGPGFSDSCISGACEGCGRPLPKAGVGSAPHRCAGVIMGCHFDAWAETGSELLQDTEVKKAGERSQAKGSWRGQTWRGAGTANVLSAELLAHSLKETVPH